MDTDETKLGLSSVPTVPSTEASAPQTTNRYAAGHRARFGNGNRSCSGRSPVVRSWTESVRSSNSRLPEWNWSSEQPEHSGKFSFPTAPAISTSADARPFASTLPLTEPVSPTWPGRRTNCSLSVALDEAGIGAVNLANRDRRAFLGVGGRCYTVEFGFRTDRAIDVTDTPSRPTAGSSLYLRRPRPRPTPFRPRV